ncbi:MAG: iron ABC transporter permease [Anaerolineae bacterium]|nr:iron ABC transporter permease [Anaerolineae bacterium]
MKGDKGIGRQRDKVRKATRSLLTSSPFLLVSLVPLTFLLLFYFYPLTSILALSFASDGHLDLTALEKLVQTPHYLRTLWFTLWQALVSTLLTVGLALPGAYVFARFEFPGKSLVQALTTIPFVLPTIVVAMAFNALLGPRGLFNTALMALLELDRPPLDLQYTLSIILLAHVFYNYTLVLRIVSTYWANLDPRLAEAARMLGASRWRAFREVTLPLLTPAVGAAALLTFIFCFTSFGVILILGGPRFATLEVEIYRQTINYFNLPLAATLSVFQIIFTFALMAAYTRLQARTALPLELRSRRSTQHRPRNWRERLLVGANVGLMLALLVTPLGALAARSFTTESGLTLDFYRSLFHNPRESAFYVPPGAAALNSLGFALATTVLAVTLGLMAVSTLAQRKETRFLGKTGVLRRLLDPILMLPLGTSAGTLGLGYIVALDEPPLDLRASPLLVVLAHTLVALPFVVRSVMPALHAISPRLREAASLLGASPWRVWREIDLSIVARAVLVGAVFAFTISMGEFGATNMIARPERPTLPVAIYRYLGRPGALNYGQALAMATLLMLACAVGFLAIEGLRVGEIGEF